jgi:sigma-B regulation protein RsbU (phosphoserine phosphatase)
MKLTLKTKIFFFVVIFVALISVPIISLSYGSLKKSSRQFEEENFSNVLLLMEDNINSRYLNLLTTEIMTVLERKIHLQSTSYLAKNTWENLSFGANSQGSVEKKENVLTSWENSLQNFNTFFGLFEKGALKNASPYFEILMQDVSRSDYKGVTLAQLLDNAYLSGEGAFAVFSFTEKDCRALEKYDMHETETPSVLLYFLPLDKTHIISFGTVLSDIKKHEQLSERAIINSIQEKFNSLALYPGSIIILFSGENKLLAHKGDFREEDLMDIPAAMLLDAQEHKFLQQTYNRENIPENSYFAKWGDTSIRLSYFKALDWYVFTAVPVSIIESHSETMLYRITMIASVVVLVSALIGLFLAYHLITPLQILTKKVLGLAQTDLADFSKEDSTSSQQRILAEFSHDLPVNRTDEVGQLAKAFANMGQALEINIKNLLQSQATTQRMQGELNAARDIQLGILKENSALPHEKGFSISAFIEPAKEVGGDLYDYFPAASGKKVIVIGDVSGKGVPAALFMAMTVTLLRYAMQAGLSPCEAMQKINGSLNENNPSCMFVTLFIGLLDEKTGEFEYANGGHCFPYIVNKNENEIRELSHISGPMVGVMEDIRYTSAKAALQSGDTLLLYTDGVTEAMNEEKALYDETRLKAVLLQQKYSGTDTLLQKIYGDILAYRGNAEQSDDITMLCFQYNKG